MKTVFMLFVLAGLQQAQASEWTALVATQGAVVSIEKVAPSPAPIPDAGSVQAGGPIDTFRDARDLISKGNSLADRGKAILDQAEIDGKITVDIRLPALAKGSCANGTCPTSPAANPHTNNVTRGVYAGDVGLFVRQNVGPIRRVLRWHR